MKNNINAPATAKLLTPMPIRDKIFSPINRKTIKIIPDIFKKEQKLSPGSKNNNCILPPFYPVPFSG